MAARVEMRKGRGYATAVPPRQESTSDDLVIIVNMPRKITLASGKTYIRTVSTAQPTDDYITILMEVDQTLTENPRQETPSAPPMPEPRLTPRRFVKAGAWAHTKKIQNLTPYVPKPTLKRVAEVISSSDEEEEETQSTYLPDQVEVLSDNEEEIIHTSGDESDEQTLSDGVSSLLTQETIEDIDYEPPLKTRRSNIKK